MGNSPVKEVLAVGMKTTYVLRPDTQMHFAIQSLGRLENSALVKAQDLTLRQIHSCDTSLSNFAKCFGSLSSLFCLFIHLFCWVLNNFERCLFATFGPNFRPFGSGRYLFLGEISPTDGPWHRTGAKNAMTFFTLIFVNMCTHASRVLAGKDRDWVWIQVMSPGPPVVFENCQLFLPTFLNRGMR